MVNNLSISTKQLEDYRIALDNFAIVGITDSKGSITYANDKFCEISKYSRDELIGQNHRILKSGFHSPKFFEKMWKTISNGNTWNGDIKNKAKDGKYYWVKTTIIPFTDEFGKINRYVSIRVDITRQKQLTEQLIKSEKFRVIGELTGKITHDIRNPLTVIMGSLGLMKRDKNIDLNVLQLKHINKIEKAADRMAYQIEDILNYLRTTSTEFKEESVLSIIKFSIENLDMPKSIELVLPTKDLNCECSFRKLDTVFTNLISNSIQAIGNNKGKIICRLIDQNDTVKIEIEDSGPGITEENLDKIFDPLFTTKGMGTGLGLPSCKNILKEHNGEISVTMKPTVFTVTLPKKQAAN